MYLHGSNGCKKNAECERDVAVTCAAQVNVEADTSRFICRHGIVLDAKCATDNSIYKKFE